MGAIVLRTSFTPFTDNTDQDLAGWSRHYEPMEVHEYPRKCRSLCWCELLRLNSLPHSGSRGVSSTKTLDSTSYRFPHALSLSHLIISDPPIPQITFYQSGIGSEGNFYSFLQGISLNLVGFGITVLTT